VLAHEFAHVAARHLHVSLPQKLLAGTAKIAVAGARFLGIWATGITGMASAVAAHVGAAFVSKEIMKSVLLCGGKMPDAQEEKIKEGIGRVVRVTATAASVSVLTWFNPLYLGLFAAAKTVAKGCTLATAGLSRSMEYQADRLAVKLGGDPLALVTSLRKIHHVHAQLSAAQGAAPVESGRLTKIWKNLHASHPTVERRAARLARIARKNGATPAQIDAALTGAVRVTIPTGLVAQRLPLMHG
jgi:heat shock protein HtpX